ncbi:MAG: polymer-forming cytoskeletal protein [Burkholderiaceae bacterium]|jgi:cytoskeletal protein CcmA (bactofilin family)|nr:polymer-forming cytoskeletal protein [Aquabacterium sp.]NUP85158.1 polymer-forming cytoskeletal protein [Burkholderiaceae bacterium]
MWNRKKLQPSIRSLLGEGSALQGTIRFREGLRVDGEVHGDVVADAEHPSMLVISEKARVHGKVKAAHVIINGEVLGPVEATELLELQPNARIVGDVRYAVLEMHPGALIEGELRPLKSADRPALTLAASNDV